MGVVVFCLGAPCPEEDPVVPLASFPCSEETAVEAIDLPTLPLPREAGLNSLSDGLTTELSNGTTLVPPPGM